MKKILLIQGPNLHYLGKRQPEIYGHTTAQELDAMLLTQAKKHELDLEIFYTNAEHQAIDKIYQALEQGVQGLIMNPAAFGFAAYALRDCLEAVNLPYVEVHLSNIAQRQRESILAPIAQGVIYGLGIQGYVLALDAISSLI